MIVASRPLLRDELGGDWVDIVIVIQGIGWTTVKTREAK